MSNVLSSDLYVKSIKENEVGEVTNLSEATIDVEYIIKSIESDDEDLRQFLFSLGCYEGEAITVISELAENYVISVKDARYSIDTELATAIKV